MGMNKIKLWIFILLLVFFVADVFAGWPTITTSQSPETLFWTSLNWLLDAITWVWFIFPILAGKLLTNDFVYGTFMHLDVILWKVWNFSRTVANFLIGFIFVFAIFKYLVSFNDKNVSVLKSYLPKLAFWTLIVNASWFILGVLIDLSTIFIVAFWGLASNFATEIYKNSNNTEYLITTDWLIKTSCDSSQKGCFGGFQIIEKKPQKPVSIKDLLSYESNISGPLMFLLDSIFDINQIKKKIRDQGFSADTNKNVSTWARMKFFLQLLVLLLFLVPIFTLIIVNLVRIFRLRIYIWFSPLIFLDQIFWNKIGLKFNNKAFSFSNMMWLIFQPPLVILAFSIAFIFLSAFASLILKKDDTHEQQFKKLLGIVHMDNWEVVAKSFMMQDVSADFSKYLGWFFWYLIITLLASWIVWSLLKLSFKASEITSKISDSIYEFSEEMLKSARVIPTPFGRQSIGSLQRLASYIEGIPGRRSWNQANRLAEMFHTIPDLTESDFHNYNDALAQVRYNYSLVHNTTTDSNLDKLFNYLQKYQGNEYKISWNRNAEKIVNTIVSKLEDFAENRNSTARTILQKINSLSDSSSNKLKVILQHSSEIKQLFKTGGNPV